MTFPVYKKKELRFGLRGVDLGYVNLRSPGGVRLLHWQRELIGACGGPDKISPAQIHLVATAVRTRCYLDDVDNFLLSLPTIVNRKRKRVIQLVRDRQELSFHLVDTLRQLGLQANALEKTAPSYTVSDFLREHEEQKEKSNVDQRTDGEGLDGPGRDAVRPVDGSGESGADQSDSALEAVREGDDEGDEARDGARQDQHGEPGSNCEAV